MTQTTCTTIPTKAPATEITLCHGCELPGWIGHMNRETLASGTKRYFCPPCSDDVMSPVFCATCKSGFDALGFCDCPITGTSS